MTNKFISYFKEEPRVPGKGSFFASLAVNIILLYVVNNLRYMGITQLTEASLISCMWALNIIFGLAIIGNFVFLMYHPIWFFYLLQTLIGIAGVNAFFFIYKIYPFNLGNFTLDHVIRVILILAMIGFFLSFLIAFYRFGINVPVPKKKAAVLAGTPPLDAVPPATDSEVPNPGENTTAAAQPASIETPPNEFKTELEPEPPVQSSPAPEPGLTETVQPELIAPKTGQTEPGEPPSESKPAGTSDPPIEH